MSIILQNGIFLAPGSSGASLESVTKKGPAPQLSWGVVPFVRNELSVVFCLSRTSVRLTTLTLKDGNRTSPACTRPFYFDRKGCYLKSMGWKQLQICEFFDLTIFFVFTYEMSSP